MTLVYLFSSFYLLVSFLSFSDAFRLGAPNWQPLLPSCSSRSSLGRLTAGRVPFVGGNWKSNGTTESVKNLVNLLNDKMPTGDANGQQVEVVVAPPFLHLGYVRDHLRPTVAHISAQDVAAHKGYGAYTGEQSADMIRDFGIPWTLAGHSERRQGFGLQGETNELVAVKTKAALDQGLKVIACIGEDLADRDSGRTMLVLSQQLKALKDMLLKSDWSRVVLAYEPVWAIGTGKSATPDMAQETHKDIREWVRVNISDEVGSNLRILYGGSVKGGNAEELSTCADIDGFLVGGAALKEDFVAIVKATAAARHSVQT
eukprot:GHVS01039640.1.p1 GENE.GHVS01039640.1~~GHVS01039640.1.p1  ORF type:complete len:315 (+),score=69.12 GHVS01039640.1:50-994(+)